MANVRDCSSGQLSLFDESDLNSLSGKTSPAHSLQTAELIFTPSSNQSCKSPFLYLNAGAMQDWLTVDTVRSRGESCQVNFSECPNVAAESSLSQILLTDVPPKYYLSPRACQGILRRAQAHNVLTPPSAYGIDRAAFNQGVNAQFKPQITPEMSATLTARGASAVAVNNVIRKLTPVECERLMGLPDDWTQGGSDSARYRALGNAVVLPCATFILNRLVEVVS